MNVFLLPLCAVLVGVACVLLPLSPWRVAVAWCRCFSGVLQSLVSFLVRLVWRTLVDRLLIVLS